MTKGKLIITVGISNSGKSTFSANLVQKNPNKYIIVNRDKIRELIYGYTEESIKDYYHREDFYRLEERVSYIEDVLINAGFDAGKIVIIDATHLKPKYLNRFNSFNCDKEIIFFNITLKEALIRNSGRNRQVDEDIIIKQYESYIELRAFLESNNKLKFEYDLQEINSGRESASIL